MDDRKAGQLEEKVSAIERIVDRDLRGAIREGFHSNEETHRAIFEKISEFARLFSDLRADHRVLSEKLESHIRTINSKVSLLWRVIIGAGLTGAGGASVARWLLGGD